jgi:hypothetical protein
MITVRDRQQNPRLGYCRLAGPTCCSHRYRAAGADVVVGKQTRSITEAAVGIEAVRTASRLNGGLCGHATYPSIIVL